MSYNVKRGFPVVVPVLAYEDVGAALEWLGRVFGFAETLRYSDGGGVIHWAEMRYGRGYLMLTEPAGLPFADQQPAGGGPRARTVVFTDDVDAHRRRTMAEGGLPVTEAADKPEGLREYDALDPGGHVWTFSQHLADVAPAAWGAVGSSDL